MRVLSGYKSLENSLIMPDGTTNITVIIAGRPYPLRVKEGDEPIIRRIVKEVNDKIALYQTSYPRKDRQDWLTMALLTFAVDLHKTQQVAAVATDSTNTTDPSLADRLSLIDAVLANALSVNN
jgi:cell division protein ZapA (FtsZ GTPase activity inhibitor)